MKRLRIHQILGLVLSTCFVGIADAATLFDQKAILYNTNYTRGVNWQSQGGVPLSATSGTPVGSNGTAPSDPAPTARQFQGAIVYGAVTFQKKTSLNASFNFPANARNLEWPHTETADGSVALVLRAQAGAPYMMRVISFLFGSPIPVPLAKEDGSLLSESEAKIYWAPEPVTSNGHANAGYYWSPHAGKVYAIQPGRVDITWRKAAPEPSAPPDAQNYALIGGNYFLKFSTNYTVSGATFKEPRKIFWTEKAFQNVSKPVQVPTARVGAVNIVYQNEFPERVSSEFVAIGQSEIVTDSTNRLQELRTLWYDRTDGQIHAYNKEGRVFVELLGDVRSGDARQQLGYEIVDVIKQPAPADVTIELGEKLTPPASVASTTARLSPEPILSDITKNFAFHHTLSGSDQVTLYATRETKNLNDYQVFWMEESVAGLRWPLVLARYQLVWPSDPAKYSHYVRPEAGKAAAEMTAVPLPRNNVPIIEWQDRDPQDNPRAFLTKDLKFYTYIDSSFPAHRTLLRFTSGDNIAFERVFSWLDAGLKSGSTLAGSVATKLDIWDSASNTLQVPESLALKAPRVVSANAWVGQRLVAPDQELRTDTEGSYLAGFIRQTEGTGFSVTAYKDPFAVGFEEAALGSIIPVNASNNTARLEVWWHRKNAQDLAKGFQPVYWPSIIGRYTIQWPTNPPHSREIILASNDGSGALSSLEARGVIYYQNNPAQPGYNPNEEHALMLGGQAYALRDDLNLITGPNYSSHPYVLLEYTDSDGRPSMSVFQVFREKGSVNFNYTINAGTALQAPMPLPFMELPIPAGVNDLSASLNTEVNGRLIAFNSVPLLEPMPAPGPKEHSVTLTTTVGHNFSSGDVYVLQEGNIQTNLLYFYSGDGLEFPNKLHGLVSSNEPARVTSLGPPSYLGKPSSLDGYTLVSGDAATEGDQARQVVFVSNTASNFQGVQVNDMVWIATRRGSPRSTRHLLKVLAVDSAARSISLEFSDELAQSLGAKSSSGLYTYHRTEINGTELTVPMAYIRYDLSRFRQFDLVIKPKTDLALDVLRDRRILSERLAPGASAVASAALDAQKVLLKDRKGTFWVYRGPHDSIDTAQFQVQWFYKTLPGFYFPELSHSAQPPAGVLAPYLRRAVVTGEHTGPTFLATGSQPGNLQSLPVTYHSEWPINAPTLFLGETLTNPKRGLPAVRGNTSLQIVYEQSLSQSPSLDAAVLFDPTREKEYQLGQPAGLEKIPDSIATSQYQGKTFFPRLPPHLQKRFFFDPNRGAKGALVLRGEFVDAPVGEDYLLLNVLGTTPSGAQSDLQIVKGLAIGEDPNKVSWDAAIEALTTRLELFVEDVTRPGTYGVGAFKNYTASQLPEITDDDEAVDSYALSAAGPGFGFVTLLRGNGRAFTPMSDPVDLQIIRIVNTLYVGEVKVLPSDNPLGEQVTFQHTADLGGRVGQFEYEWRIAPPADGLPLPLARNEDDPGAGWLPAQNGLGLAIPRFVQGGTGVQTLSDNYVIVHYRPKDPNHPFYNQWSDWTEPQLAEGWIKRVLAGINPFNQRVSDLFNNRVNTDVSILTQAGARWEGDVALNQEAVNNAGLIEIYETVLRRGKSLSIESGINFGPANDTLLLAAGYLNDLYMMLGNEAWADAANPTIGIGTQDSTYGDIATALFAFKGQVGSLLEEELSLLRGRDDFLLPGVEIAPVYNRLFWNYTRGIDSGEVIYALNYNIQENNDSGVNGVINADDARKMFPQGHGDAYGHYLTSLKNYYSLIMDTDFDWVPRIEAVTVLGKAVSVDFQDERKFAAAAAAVARTGRQIFDLTWRKDYSPGQAGWEHLSATRANTRRKVETTRYWGVDHWAARTSQGAYLNWAMGNAILPDIDPDPTHEGIQKVDRTTVLELKELATMAQDLQTALDNAEAHLTPLGLPHGSVAFDINPAQLTGPEAQTHFEQVYGRAKVALNNALAAFDDAKDVTRLLRSEQDSLAAVQTSIGKQELAYTNALIELYGTPYSDDVGAGKTYPQGYAGPDLIHYSYAELPETRFPELWSYTEMDRIEVEINNVPKNYQDVVQAGDQFDKRITNIVFELGPHGFFGKPKTWTGKRSSPGKLQQAASEIIASHTRLRQAVNDAAGARNDWIVALQLFHANVDTQNQIIDKRRSLLVAEEALEQTKFANELIEKISEAVKETYEGATEGAIAALPVSFIAGLAAGGDLTSAARAALGLQETALERILSASAIARAGVLSAFAQATATSKRWVEFKEIATRDRTIELRQSILDLANQLSASQSHLWTINQCLRQREDAWRNYRALVAEGERIQAEREIFRQRSAALVQGFRTRDAAFRIFRNEKLERYKTLFDLTARYTFLAANSYDYETGLLHQQRGQEFINRIVNSRALGVVRQGEPQFAGSNTGDPGLSSVLAEMKADFEVLRGRLGFNNPDAYGTTVSLRMEKERIIPAADGHATWQDVLERGRRANLLDDQDVRRYCMQIDRGNGLPVPGIIIEFSTTIEDGVNLFGKNLAGGDHYFDTSLFATKIFGVGVAFEGYIGMDNPVANTSAITGAGGYSPPDPSTTFLGSLSLAATPGVYLIPVGVDSMRSPPLGDTGQIRSWNVQDVAVPLPFNIGGSDFSTKALWQSGESLTEPLFAIRKHQAFRPVSTTAAFSPSIYGELGSLQFSQFTNNRLIGRSVWNTKWKLVIPGHKLLSDPIEGLDRFTQTVKDVKLHFVTYSYAGN